MLTPAHTAFAAATAQLRDKATDCCLRQTMWVQVGSTPEGTELPRCVVDEACQAVVRAQVGLCT